VSKVCLISDQPVLRSGFARVLENQGFEVAHCTMEALNAHSSEASDADLALVDVTSGLSFESLAELNSRLPGCPVVLWSDALPLDLVFRTLEFGVRGLVPRTAAPELLVSSLKKVANGEMQIGFASSRESAPSKRQVALTPREREIVMRLRQGLRNKQIATEMNITEGTVKIYLFRLFHKLGVRNRFELASYGGLDNPQFPQIGAQQARGPQLVEPAL
jgi:DNA-binding NarL/FixJ family response regulator